ncbi:Hus1-like protein [Piedraia hortae CBS 480.64]|uniref:Checkpoint protein n=1 Tax=Piedraia hortae CBS 480.64 TaxID=1314780 RepID=A0A6A7BVY4_9PEZI|nr:Hus1-like protein [Piedraia hortae CBS 480.64]
MRFRAEIRNVHTFTRFTASLATLGHIAWVRFDSTDVRFTVIPEMGSQVWSVLAPDVIFDTYIISSAATNNMINLEVPMGPLQRALKSAHNALAANIRLTKKGGIPVLSVTITSSATGSLAGATDIQDGSQDVEDEARHEREIVITQDIPVRVLAPETVENLHQPRCRDSEVHIVLPNPMQLKSISERFTKLAVSSKKAGRSGFAGNSLAGPKLELSANMHGCLRLSLKTDSMKISSLWTGLENPELDATVIEGGQGSLADHPSTRMKALGDATGQSDQGWATVRVEGKDWGRVLSVGRLGGRVIACFCHEHALILYVFLDEGESVLTYYITSYSV